MYLIECSTINQILLCKYYLSSGTVILPARKSGESYQEFITKPPIKRKTLRLIPLIQCEIFMLVDQMPPDQSYHSSEIRTWCFMKCSIQKFKDFHIFLKYENPINLSYTSKNKALGIFHWNISSSINLLFLKSVTIREKGGITQWSKWSQNSTINKVYCCVWKLFFKYFDFTLIWPVF